MSATSAARLRRLRWLLVWLFTGLNAVGLILYCWLLVRDDGRSRDLALDAQLQRVTSTVTRLIHYDGAIVTADVARDPMNAGCPQFAVLPGADVRFTGYQSARTCVAVDNATLTGLARQATESGTLLSGTVQGGDGLVRVCAQPFLEPGGRYVGAVVATLDAQESADAHDERVLLLIGGCVLLVGVAGVAGYLIAGRALRPATKALAQQEILIAETAHDLRTPVAALRALAETALRNPAHSADLLPRTVRLAGRMGEIIDGLLVRARLSAGADQLAVRRVRLDELVAGVVRETPAEGGEVTLTAAPTEIDADPVLVQRAIANLLDNALRYGHEPGARAVVHITVAGGRVTVADHGPGVDAARAEAAFEQFTGEGSSSGLGLSIVRWVAQAHGGELRVYNAEQGGAIFELVLPLSAP
ncbi:MULTISPECIES: sensor histidine kinase KdpD [unclassified Amycolatopsis]|uniref:sensor histidine kinase n=1 Tax=unclassified Amycolatopsis TaxID=2618356 RepID=UPI001FF3CCBD|nr:MULTISPECIES: HAMP domain-containing sensor histidine kinase [unclassified Amycolatopsis]UOZ07785.1 HAMP domain-containing histidine kinase [Amycolatopsis sp. WQ 127309]WSK82316.1 HAMP domain-containing histidine kinase [Amycolatopsis sp. NBC_01286]